MKKVSNYVPFINGKVSALCHWKQFLLILFLFIMSQQLWAQQASRFTVQFKDVTLNEVFLYLEKNSDYTFTYNSNMVKNADWKITGEFTNATIEQILTFTMRNSPFKYEIADKHVVISRNEPQIRAFPIQGRVTDAKGDPLPGVTIVIEGTRIGFASDHNGNFSATVPTEKGILEFSFVGFKKQKKAFESGKKIVVKMQEDVSDLDEVTIIGYGERKKREMIGSVSSVKAEDIKEIPSASIENLLQGRMAGVEITNMSGAPGGGGAVVAVRGYNSLIDQSSLAMSDYGEPLYVIDGIPVQGYTSPVTGTNTLSSIDPSTIESIEVLKDAASAAIYGSRAGRGVILITTKKGREGDAKFSANASYTFSILPSSPIQTGGRDARRYALQALKNGKRPYKDPQTGVYKFPSSVDEAYGLHSFGGVYDMLWGKTMSGISSDGRNPVNSFVQDSLNPFYNNSTDWFRYAFRTGKVLNANLQASGGSAKMRYLVGAGVYDEKGIAYGSDFTRVNFLTNLNITPIKNMVLDSRISLTYMGRTRGNGGSKWGSATKIERMPVDPKKTPSFLPGGGTVEEQLLQSINEQQEKNESYDIKASLVLNYEFAPGFKLSVNGSGSYSMGILNLFLPTTLTEDGLNTSSFELERHLSLLNENILSYRKSFVDKHNVELMAGFSLQKNIANLNTGKGRGGASDKVHYIYQGFPELPAANIQTQDVILQHAGSQLEETAMISWFARLAYNYRERYLFELTMRQDGSSVFGSENKYATFPAAAIGWAFSEEKFMDWAWWLSYAKFRLSYGRQGEVFPDPYRAHGLLIPGGDFLGRPVMSVDDDALHNGGMINRALKWVKHDQYDIGFDFDLLDYRLKFKCDYYYRWSTGVLANTKLPATIYVYDNQPQNAHDISNEGIELEVVADWIRTSNWSWRMRFNASRNWNRLKDTYNNKDVGYPSHVPDHMLGRPLYGMYLFEEGKIYESLDQIPIYYDVNGNKHYAFLANNQYPFGVGMKAIKDLNGDGKADYLDKSYQGQTIPKIYGGIANEIRWKNLDVSILFNYSLGRKMINAYGYESLNHEAAISGKNIYMDLNKLTFWQKPGDANIEGILPQLAYFDNTMMQFYPQISSNLETVNYIKLKQLTVGYNFPKSWVKRIHLDDVRLFFTGENLFTWTNYSGEDPEVVSIFDGIDNFTAYPLARKLTIGLTVNF